MTLERRVFCFVFGHVWRCLGQNAEGRSIWECSHCKKADRT